MKEEVLAAMADENGHVTTQKGLKFERYFSSGDVSPYDAVEWDRRTASIASEAGGVVFEQRECRSPQRLVADCSEYRGVKVLSRYPGDAGAGDKRKATDFPSDENDDKVGFGRRIFRFGDRCRDF